MKAALLAGGVGLADEPPTFTGQRYAWWADDLLGTYSDGAPVDSWTDRIDGEIVNAGTTNRPSFETNMMNGHPVVLFNGTSHRLLGDLEDMEADSAGVIIAVIDHSQTGVGQVMSLTNTASAQQYLMGGLYSPGGGYRALTSARNTADNDQVYGDDTIADSTPTIVEWSSTGGAFETRVNNDVQSLSVLNGNNSGDWADKFTGTNFSIGNRRISGTPDNYYAGQIAYLAVGNQQLSSGDRTALYVWLSAYYGITI